jgi:hypothetical protein
MLRNSAAIAVVADAVEAAERKPVRKVARASAAA